VFFECYNVARACFPATQPGASTIETITAASQPFIVKFVNGFIYGCFGQVVRVDGFQILFTGKKYF
jgi:hypothetical protein